MSQHVQQHDRLYLRQATHPELVQAPVTGVGIDTFGGAGTLLVDLLGFWCRHALPPLGHLGCIVRTWRVGIPLGILGGLHRRVYSRARLFDLFYVFLLREAAVDQHFFGFFLVALLVLLDHRRQFALIASGVGHVDARDDLRLGVGGQLHVKGRSITAVAHFHH